MRTQDESRGITVHSVVSAHAQACPSFVFRPSCRLQANKVAFDRAGEVVAVASDDSKIKFISALTGEDLAELEGHEDAVQVVLFDDSGKFMVSGSSDRTYRIWSS